MNSHFGTGDFPHFWSGNQNCLVDQIEDVEWIFLLLLNILFFGVCFGTTATNCLHSGSLGRCFAIHAESV